MMNNYTYILQCNDGSLYCGWTNNITKRLASHQSGKASKCTRSRRPVHLVYYEVFDSKEQAMSREWHIKHLTRKEKLNLIRDYYDGYSNTIII